MSNLQHLTGNRRRCGRAAALVWVVGCLVAAVGQDAGIAGFYRVATRADTQWMIAPSGAPTLVLGVNRVRLITPTAPRTDLEAAYVDQRSTAIVAGLEADGFNTLGADSDADVWHHGLPYAENLGLSQHLQADEQTALVDVYDPGFAGRVQALAQAACAPRRDDPELVGYFSDDGLGWDPAEHADAVLRYYLQLPLGAAGRQRAMDYLRDRYGSDIRNLNRAWGVKGRDFTALTLPRPGQSGFAADAAPFAANVLVRYLQVAADAIHAADANHLYLGANLHFDPAAPPEAGTPAALAWSVPDVASVALDPGQEASVLLQRLRQVTPRPVVLRVAGCQGTPATAGMFGAPGLVGYFWTPSGDWQSGACAAQANAVWGRMNRSAVATHGKGGGGTRD